LSSTIEVAPQYPAERPQVWRHDPATERPPRYSAEQMYAERIVFHGPRFQGMAAVGVTPEYVREMRRQGLPAGDPDQAIESRVLFSKAKHAAIAPPVPPVPPVALARAVSISSPDGSRTVIGANGLTVRSPDGSRTAIGKDGLSVRSPDGSTTVINHPPDGDDD